MTAAQVRSYAVKGAEYLAAADSELSEGRSIAATSRAIHAAINAADVITGVRLGKRAAGPDHEEVCPSWGKLAPTKLKWRRSSLALLPLKTKTECEPVEVPKTGATKALERARRRAAVAYRVVRAQAP